MLVPRYLLTEASKTKVSVEELLQKLIVVVKSCVLVYRTRSCFEALVPTLPLFVDFVAVYYLKTCVEYKTFLLN